MGYIKKEIRDLIDEMKYSFRLPSRWNSFIYDTEKKHNIIIKQKNSYYCTNCQQTYTYLNKGPKIGQEAICEKCKGKYEVRSNRLRKLRYKDNVLLLDKVNNKLIIRIFEMLSIYDPEKGEMKHSTVEYARKFVDYNYLEIRNERVSIAQCGPFVYHFKDDEGTWRQYDGWYYGSYGRGWLYPYNLENVLKDTYYEHSRLWEYVLHNNSVDLEYLLKCADAPSFEMLVELKLFELAKSARQFAKRGSFYSIFGVSKDYYAFMKKHDINYEMLEVLRQYPTKDIKKLKFLYKHRHSIEDIIKYTHLDNFITYFRKKRLKDSAMYADYLRFASELGLDLKNKRYLFPDNLKLKHDEYEEQFKLHEHEIFNKKIFARYDSLKIYEYKNNEYVIFPAKSVEDLIEESKQQNNCVRTYAERYADGCCAIFFMRNKNTPMKSLVTIEVRNGHIVQKRTKNNQQTNEEQDKVLEEWEDKVLNSERYVKKKKAV